MAIYYFIPDDKDTSEELNVFKHTDTAQEFDNLKPQEIVVIMTVPETGKN